MEHYDIFISYKRKSLPTANNLYYRLTTRGYSTFFDLEEMRRDNFNVQLLNYIENAKDVFVILEEGSLDGCKKENWENEDWFCHEIAFALEKKKNIIPILLGNYKMPSADFFPDKLKELSLKHSPDFSFSFFEAYLDKLIEKRFITAEAHVQNKSTSVFKFYSNENCQVFKEGKLVCSLEGMSEQPYYLPVPRKGDYWFTIVNNTSKNIKKIKEIIDAAEEKIIEINWERVKSGYRGDSLESIFISYKRCDKDRVFEIKKFIENSTGENCWIDIEGIESDAQFANVIINAINNAKVFLFMYSSAHSQITNYDNDWTVREIYYAYKKNKRIVFVNIDGTPLTDWFELIFGTKQQIDASSKESMHNLCKDLNNWLKVNVGETKIENKKEAKKIIEEENQEKRGSKSVNGAIINKEADSDVLQKDIDNCNSDLSQNYTEAFKWYLEAAEQGDMDAQRELGYMYQHGWGVEVSEEEAARWFLEAAEQGDMEAQCELGYIYKFGWGVEENEEVSAKWFRESAEQGYPEAQREMGNLSMFRKRK